MIKLNSAKKLIDVCQIYLKYFVFKKNQKKLKYPQPLILNYDC